MSTGPRSLPEGRVTFVFTDVVGSTRQFIEHGNAYAEALTELHALVSAHARRWHGTVVETEGDGAFLAFPDAVSAVEAISALQEEIESRQDEPGLRLRIRAGAHTGDAAPVGGHYLALAVYVAARVSGAANAGQLLVSDAVVDELVEREWPSLTRAVDVGRYALKDIADGVTIWRVAGGAEPPRAMPVRRTNVQRPRTTFVGRTEEIRQLGDLVSSPGLVTVVGPGGVGKTRLVSELALLTAETCPGGTWMVELATLATADQVHGAVSQVLGIQATDVEAITAQVRHRGEMLLVLDNCEHLADAAAELVIELLEGCPDLRLLCTSREPLLVTGEVVWRLPPLVEQRARVELFTQRAEASAAASEATPDAINRLCAALDGLPLAIELAATQAGSTTLAELIRIAEHGTDDLARRGGQTRQRSLDAVLAWSLDRLPAARRTSLLTLSLLPGRFDLQMAAGILSAVEGCEPNAVRFLARASLVDLDGENYRILETIRHAARRELETNPPLAAAARRGLRTWAQNLARAEYRSRRRYDDVPLDQLLALETALEHAMDDGATQIGTLWRLVQSIVMDREPSDRIVALAKRVLTDGLPADPEDVLSFAAAIHVHQLIGQVPAPNAHLEAVATAADAFGVTYPAASLHFRLTLHYIESGDLAAARRHVEAYLPFAESPEADPVDRRHVHQLRLGIAHAAGELAERLMHAERDLDDARQRADDIDLDISEGNLAEALLDLGRAEEALPHALEAVRLSPLSGPQRRFMLLQLARAHSDLGDTDAARATAREIESELRTSGRSPERVQAELQHLRRHVPALTEDHAGS